MKLAEALIERKDLQARIADLQTRYTSAAVVEEGESADEQAPDLLMSLEGAMVRMKDLTVCVNRTNNVIRVGELSMMEAIALRDNLKLQIGQYTGILNAIRHRNQNRRHYGDNAPKMAVVDGVNASVFIKKVDSLSQELRLLDAQIQAANWASDLVA